MHTSKQRKIYQLPWLNMEARKDELFYIMLKMTELKGNIIFFLKKRKSTYATVKN